MPEIKLVITTTPEGAVTVEGPIDQPILCYGLLGVAHDVIRDHCERKARTAEPLVKPAFGMVPAGLRR